MGVNSFEEVMDRVGLEFALKLSLLFLGFKRIHQGFNEQSIVRAESLEVPVHRTLVGSGL